MSTLVSWSRPSYKFDFWRQNAKLNIVNCFLKCFQNVWSSLLCFDAHTGFWHYCEEQSPLWDIKIGKNLITMKDYVVNLFLNRVLVQRVFTYRNVYGWPSYLWITKQINSWRNTALQVVRKRKKIQGTKTPQIRVSIILNKIIIEKVSFFKIIKFSEIDQAKFW